MLKIDFTTKPTFGISSQTRTMTIPIKVMETARSR